MKDKNHLAFSVSTAQTHKLSTECIVFLSSSNIQRTQASVVFKSVTEGIPFHPIRHHWVIRGWGSIAKNIAAQTPRLWSLFYWLALPVFIVRREYICVTTPLPVCWLHLVFFVHTERLQAGDRVSIVGQWSERKCFSSSAQISHWEWQNRKHEKHRTRRRR